MFTIFQYCTDAWKFNSTGKVHQVFSTYTAHYFSIKHDWQTLIMSQPNALNDIGFGKILTRAILNRIFILSFYTLIEKRNLTFPWYAAQCAGVQPRYESHSQTRRNNSSLSTILVFIKAAKVLLSPSRHAWCKAGRETTQL
jgi:hypothetical protein